MYSDYYRLLKELQVNPELSQRELAKRLGISVGKTNHCLRDLLEKGWIETQEHPLSVRTRGFAYLLTAAGQKGKTQLARDFLASKRAEVESLRREIKELHEEVRHESENE